VIRRIAPFAVLLAVLSGVTLTPAFAVSAPAGSITAVDQRPAYFSGPGAGSFPLAPQQAGDAYIGFIEIDPATTTVSSLTSGNVTWSRVTQVTGADGKDFELWLGTIDAAGADTVTIHFAGAVGTASVETGFQEFTAAGYGTAASWSAGPRGAASSATTTTTIQYPALTAAGTGELYWGYGETAATGSPGTTPGFSYDVTPQVNVVAWNTGSSGTLAPTAPTTPASSTQSVAAVFTVSLRAPLTPGTVTEALNPPWFGPLVMDARSDSRVNPATNGDPVQVWDSLGSANQRFQVVAMGSGSYELRSAVSGKCLDAIADGRNRPDMNGDKLQLWACLGNSNQLWRPYASSGAGAYAVACAASGKVIDDPNGGGSFTRLQLWSYNGRPQQFWSAALP
jgi:Ricin-type beta-trefoil lectin domain-like